MDRRPGRRSSGQSSRQPSRRDRHGGGGHPGRSDALEYHSTTSQDPHSARFDARRHQDRSGRGGSRRHDADDDVPAESQFPRDTAARQATRIERFRRSAEQLFRTSPCHGAMWILGTLVIFWFVGICVAASRFGCATREVGEVQDLVDLAGALKLMGKDRRAQSWGVMLAMFVGATVYTLGYVGVVLVYGFIVNRKAVYDYMKRTEVKNEELRKKGREENQDKGWRIIYRNRRDTR